jgi:hypothetical protein
MTRIPASPLASESRTLVETSLRQLANSLDWCGIMEYDYLSYL